MKLTVTFLGTGTSQGVPVIACECGVCRSANPYDKRLRASVLVATGNGVSFVIDAGPDFRQQMLQANVRHIDGILLTHEHKDHVAGLDDVRAFNYITGQAVKIYAEQRVQDALRKEYSYAFAEKKYPGIPEFDLQTIDERPFQVAGVEIIPVRVMHHRLPIFAFRIGTFAYVTDASFISDESKEKLRGLDTLVINAVRIEKHLTHFSLPEVVALAEELQPHMTYITHISHQMGLHHEVQKKLPANIRLAYDGLVIEA